MTDTFRLMLVQADPTVGDIAGNAGSAREYWAKGRAAGQLTELTTGKAMSPEIVGGPRESSRT